MPGEPAVEFEGETADGGTVPKGLVVVDVGTAESFDVHAADVAGGFDEDDALAELGGLDRGGEASGGAAVDDDVVGFAAGQGEGKEQGEKEKGRFHEASGGGRPGR